MGGTHALVGAAECGKVTGPHNAFTTLVHLRSGSGAVLTGPGPCCTRDYHRMARGGWCCGCAGSAGEMWYQQHKQRPPPNATCPGGVRGGFRRPPWCVWAFSMVVAHPDLSLQLENVALPGTGPWRIAVVSGSPCALTRVTCGPACASSAWLGMPATVKSTSPGVEMTVRGSTRGPTHKSVLRGQAGKTGLWPWSSPRSSAFPICSLGEDALSTPSGQA